MSKLYVARDESGDFVESTKKLKNWYDGTWDCKEEDLGENLFFGFAMPFSEKHSRSSDYHKLMAIKYPFIKPGEQWVREENYRWSCWVAFGGDFSMLNNVDVPSMTVPEVTIEDGDLVVYFWRRIAILDDGVVT